MPCFYEGRWRKAQEAFWVKRATQQFLSPRDDDDSQSVPKKRHTKTGRSRRCSDVIPYTLLHTKRPEWNHLVHLIWVCEHVCAQVCIFFWSVVTHTWRTDLRVSTMRPHLLMLMLSSLLGFFFFWFYVIFFPHHFVFFFFCEDANVTHKVSIVKKKKNTLLGLFAI